MNNVHPAAKALTFIAVIGGVVGVLTVAIAVLTWPHYDPVSALTAAQLAADALDVPFDPTHVASPPSTVGHVIAVVIGGLLILLAVFTLIMRLVVAANGAPSTSTPGPNETTTA